MSLPTPRPAPEKTAKHSVTMPMPVYDALKAAAEQDGLEPYEVIQNLVIDYVIAKGTLDPATQQRIELGRRLIEQAVGVARQRCRDGHFSRSITLDTFRDCANDPGWAADYRSYVGDDIYKHGNPLKSINREIGFRIRAAIGGVVETGPDGKAVLEKVLGQVIQSFTPMRSFDRKRVEVA